MTQQPGWGQPPAQQFPQQGYAPQAPQGFPGQPAPQGGNPWGGGQQQYRGPAPMQSQEGEEFDDFFSGGEKGAPGYDFGATQNGGEKAVGAQIIGTIVKMVKQQQRDFSSGNPLWFDNGDPRMQVAVTLQTDLRGWAGVKPKLIPKDPATEQPLGPEHDNGERRIFVKGDMVRAVNVACQAAGQKPRVGGKLAVRIKGFQPTDKGNDKTLYDAAYQPAPEKVETDAFFGQAEPAPQAPQGYAPQQQYAQGGPVQGYAPAPQQGYPQQQFPSQLGNNPAPQQAPDFAQPGYAPQAPQQQAAPEVQQAPPAPPAAPQGFEAPQF